jgi:hypothetical protein
MSDESAHTEGPEATEDELRAAYEAQVKQIQVQQIVLENVVTVLNLGMRRTGIAPGTEDELDLDQVRVAIESVRVQLPLIEQILPTQVRQIRDALSQLQMAYVRIGGHAPGQPSPGPATAAAPGDQRPPASGSTGPAPAPAEDDSAPAEPGEPGPAQRSGRLWIPGQ